MVTAVEEMKKVISLADIMKVSDEESLLLTGASNYEDASDEFLKMGEDGIPPLLCTHNAATVLPVSAH